jgi:anaerobic sulfite reductase subunit C
VSVVVGRGCTACGACLHTCPERALLPAAGRPAVDGGRCTECMACVEICPAGAITVESVA